MSDVVTERNDTIVTITLNRPEKLNAMTAAMYAAVQREVEATRDDSSVCAVVLRGAGRSFSAGWDRNEPVLDLAAVQRQTNACRWALWDCPHPVIVVTQGHCLGGAFELIHPADIVISSEDCLFGMPEVADGVVAGFNMLPWLSNHKQAKASMLTAEMFPAEVAYARGIVTHLFPPDGLERSLHEIVSRLKAVPPQTLAAIKGATNQVYERLGMRQMIDESVAALEGKGVFLG